METTFLRFFILYNSIIIYTWCSITNVKCIKTAMNSNILHYITPIWFVSINIRIFIFLTSGYKSNKENTKLICNMTVHSSVGSFLKFMFFLYVFAAVKIEKLLNFVLWGDYSGGWSISLQDNSCTNLILARVKRLPFQDFSIICIALQYWNETNSI